MESLSKEPKRATKKVVSKLQKSEEIVKKEKEIQRRYKGKESVISDVFILETTNTRKNLDWSDDPNKAIWEAVPHKHVYRSYDSSGKKMEYPQAINGHTHEIMIKEVDGEFIAECGPAIVVHKGKKYKYKNDQHTHEITYRHSEEIELRKMNPEAVKVISARMREETELAKNPMV